MRFLHNNFYFGRVPPSVVIALDSPTFGMYERQLLRQIFPPQIARIDNTRESRLQQQQKEKNISSPITHQNIINKISRPILICADGAYKKVAEFCGIPSHHIDFVVGDLDTLKPEPEVISAVVDKVSDFPIPTTTEEIDRLLADTTSSIARLRHIPFILKVRDQDSTDYEKCLQFCKSLFRAEKFRCENDESEQNSNVVLTIGGQGGEWHHEASILHTAAKYSRHLHLRLHSVNSTIMFCAPTGKTVFQRNKQYESDVFGVVPLGVAPKKIKTTGLKWNLDVDAANQNQGMYFGWTNVLRKTLVNGGANMNCSGGGGESGIVPPSIVKVPSYISTSNRFADDGELVEIDMFDGNRGQNDIDSLVVALTVNNRRVYVQQLIETATKSTTVDSASSEATTTCTTIARGAQIEQEFLVKPHKQQMNQGAPATAAAKVVVSVILADEFYNKYLLVLDNGAVWSLPYQRLRFGEETLEAAQRLVREVFASLSAPKPQLRFESPHPVRTWSLLPKKERHSHLVVVEHAAFVDSKSGDFLRTVDGKIGAFFTRKEIEEMAGQRKADNYVLASIENFERHVACANISKL